MNTSRRSQTTGADWPKGTFPGHERGFTLVELLVVIAIIGILIGLLMPAVNAARERGRFSVCANKAKQLALAYTQHEATNQFMAGGGWGWGWVGDPTRGVGMRQPGGWVYNILPYIEQKDLHDITNPTTLVGYPLAITLCPTRRPVQTFIYTPHGGNYSAPAAVGRTDYASNGGDVVSEPDVYGIWGSGNCGNSACGPSSIPTDATLANDQSTIEKSAASPTGIDYPLSMLRTASIKDGMSFTYLLGEKYVPSILGGTNSYLNGGSTGDNENEYAGHNADVSRWTWRNGPLPPSQDRPNVDEPAAHGFGSAHESGLNMAFCDGSVKKINYDIDPIIHKQLGNRKDGGPLQLEGTGIGESK